jgi:hypothetical protein
MPESAHRVASLHDVDARAIRKRHHQFGHALDCRS